MLQVTCPIEADLFAVSNSINPDDWQVCSSSQSVAHTLSSGDGVKTVYARWRNSYGISDNETDDIFLDTVAPITTDDLQDWYV